MLHTRELTTLQKPVCSSLCHPCCLPFPAAAAAESLQSCPTLCDPMDGSPTRLPCPWDSPGKNTGVAVLLFFRYYLKSAHTNTLYYQYVCVKISCLAICSNMNGPGDYHSE